MAEKFSDHNDLFDARAENMKDTALNQLTKDNAIDALLLAIEAEAKLGKLELYTVPAGLTIPPHAERFLVKMGYVIDENQVITWE